MSSDLDFDDDAVATPDAAPQPEVQQLQVILGSSGLVPQNALQLRQQFDGFFSQALGLKMVAQNIKDPATARTTRLAMVKIRTGSEKLKDELKADILKRGRVIDALLGVITGITKPVEAKLFDIENAEERKIAQARAARADSFIKALAPYEVNTDFIDLAEMSDADFQKLLIDSKYAFEGRQAAAAEAEKKRLADEEAKRLENDRLKAENARLKAESDAAAQKARDAKAAADKAAADAKRTADAALAQANAAAKKLQDERAAIQQRENDRIAAEQEAASKLAAAPDREKLIALRDALNAVKFPQLTSAKGEWAQGEVQDAFMDFITILSTNIDKLS